MDVTIRIHTQPEALLKIFAENPSGTDTLIYCDNTDPAGNSAPITLTAGEQYYLDVTNFVDDSVAPVPQNTTLPQ